jgi:hypothetical protein
MSFAAAANFCASLGFRVFPLVPRDKMPLKLNTGDHFDAATTDPEQIQSWAVQKPTANVGLCPDENFCFLETDDDDALHDACKDLPEGVWATMRVSARPNRCYYVFRQTMRTRKAGNMTVTQPNKPNLFELKQHRMYVVGPGSIHPKTGGPYTANEERIIPAMPDILLRRLCELYGAPDASAIATMSEETKDQTELLDRFLEYYEIATVGDWFRKGKQWYRPIICPWADSHQNLHEGDSSCIVYTEGGGYGYKCQHRCSEKGWKIFRAEMESRFPDKPKFQFVEPGSRVVVGRSAAAEVPVMETEPASNDDKWNPRLELERVDYIDLLADELTKGTPLPFAYARETLKLLLLAGVYEPPILPWFKTLHLRQYVILLSDEPGIGKGETWRRCTATLEKASIPSQFIDGDSLGSPEFAVIRFGGQVDKQRKQSTVDLATPKIGGIVTQITKPRNIVFYDEGKKLAQKNQAAGSSGLITMYTKLFDGNRHSTGSFRNGYAVVQQANVSLMLHFVREAFELTFAGTGVTADGFLSRCTFIVDYRNPLEGDWRIVDSVRVAGLIEKIRECMKRTTTDLEIAPEVAALRVAFLNELRQLEPKFRSRLEFLFNQDLLVRSLFSAEGRMDAGAVDRAARWTRHQYQTRRIIYPLDVSPDKREQMSTTLRNAFLNHGPLTRAQGMRYGNVARIGSGGYTIFAQVWGAMALALVGKTQRGTPLYWPPDLGPWPPV